MKNERMRKWNIYDVSVNAKLSTFNITHFYPILFHITLGAPLGLALNLSCGFPFARPRLSRCLTHTGVGVLPIQVSVSHPYTQWGLTHRTFRKSGRRLFPLYIISQDSLSSSPLTLARIHRSLTLVIFALSHSSSPPRHFRHLSALTLVISQHCHSPSPSSDTRHLPRDNDWGAGENIFEPLMWMQVSTRSVCLTPPSLILSLNSDSSLFKWFFSLPIVPFEFCFCATHR